MKTVAILEGYDGPRRFKEEHPLISSQDGATALSRLDGRRFSAVYFEQEGDVVLTVTGGPERFQVSLWDDAKGTGSEAVDVGEKGDVLLVIAGQSANLARSDTVDLETATKATVAFLNGTGLHPELVWRPT